MKQTTLPAILLLILSMGCSTSSVNTINTITTNRCDELAASTSDAKNPVGVLGVNSNDIQTQPAITACEKAVATSPQYLRYQFQLGRAYSADKNHHAAANWYHKATENGHVLGTV